MSKRRDTELIETASGVDLTDRERQVLEAVVRSYVDTAEPAGSRRVARDYALRVSPATIRNTMSDLEEKGYLFHPHTSAGRIPTDLAYRYFVDRIIGRPTLTRRQRERVAHELEFGASAVEDLIGGVARALTLLTRELGVAIEPHFDEAVLEKLELVRVSESKVLLVATIRSGAVRTIYVDLGAAVPEDTLVTLTLILNERLAGLTFQELRDTLEDRLRDSGPGGDHVVDRFLNIFLEVGADLFDFPGRRGAGLRLGHASVLATQPEFDRPDSLKGLIELTERRDLLADAVGGREHRGGLRITIGGENEPEALGDFALVTAQYEVGDLKGVIGVMGPTRMPYEKVIAIVDYTSTLVTQILKS